MRHLPCRTQSTEESLTSLENHTDTQHVEQIRQEPEDDDIEDMELSPPKR